MNTPLTVKQAAQRLGVSAKLVYALCAAGQIAHERHGLGRGTIRIPEDALEEYRGRAAGRWPGPPPAPLRHLSHPTRAPGCPRRGPS
jgi:excisionase family DNA binding protein